MSTCWIHTPNKHAAAVCKLAQLEVQLVVQTESLDPSGGVGGVYTPGTGALDHQQNEVFILSEECWWKLTETIVISYNSYILYLFKEATTKIRILLSIICYSVWTGGTSSWWIMSLIHVVSFMLLEFEPGDAHLMWFLVTSVLEHCSCWFHWWTPDVLDNISKEV